LKLGKKLKLWNKPFLTIFGNEDDIMTGAEKTLQKLIPSKGQNHAILNAGHFIQEEKEKNLLNLLFNFTI
jgi:haloalkane dehalogenase